MPLMLKGQRSAKTGLKPTSMVATKANAIKTPLPTVKPQSGIDQNSIKHINPTPQAPTSVGGHPGGVKVGYMNKDFITGFEKAASVGSFVGSKLRGAINNIGKLKSKSKQIGGAVYDKGVALAGGAKDLGSSAIKAPGKAMGYVADKAYAARFKGEHFINNQVKDFKRTAFPQKAPFQQSHHPMLSVQRGGGIPVGKPMGAHNLNSMASSKPQLNLTPTTQAAINKSNMAQRAIPTNTGTPVVSHAPSKEIRKEQFRANKADALAKSQAPVNTGAPVVNQGPTKEQLIANHKNKRSNQDLRQMTAGNKERGTLDRLTQRANVTAMHGKRVWKNMTPNQRLAAGAGAGVVGGGGLMYAASGSKNEHK